MSTTGQLRAEPEPLPSADKDYAGLLAENLALLRKTEELHLQIETLDKAKDAAMQAQSEAEKALLKEQLKKKLTRVSRATLRVLVWLYSFCGIMMLFAPMGLYLWFYYLGNHPDAAIITFVDVGIIVLAVTAVWATALAEEERVYEGRN